MGVLDQGLRRDAGPDHEVVSQSAVSGEADPGGT